MSNEIVKYENRLNEIPLRRFNAREMNLFFSIASRVRDKGTDEIDLSFNQLRDLSQYSDHGERFVQDLNQTYHKLLALNAMNDDGHTITAFVLFTQYEIDRDNEMVRISVNSKFKGMFNELGTWTRFGLEQFASLKSTYSKTMFRLLKQYRTVGRRDFTMEEFRLLLDVPKSYSVSDIDKQVLKYIKEELVPVFKGLQYRKNRKGRGSKIIGYTFTWKPETANANDFSEGTYIDRSRKLENIKHNNELTHSEKVAATRRVIGRDASIDDLPAHINPTIETKAQKTERKAKNDANRSKTALDIARLEAKGAEITAIEKDTLTKLRKQYAKFVELDN